MDNNSSERYYPKKQRKAPKKAPESYQNLSKEKKASILLCTI